MGLHSTAQTAHNSATEPSGSSAATSGSHDVPTNGHWSSDRSADAVDDRQDRHYSQMTNGGYVSGDSVEENNNAGAHDYNLYVHTPHLVEGATKRISSPDHLGSSTGALGPPEHQHPGGEIVSDITPSIPVRLTILPVLPPATTMTQWPTALQSTTEGRHRDAAVAAGDDLSSSGPSTREYIAGSVSMANAGSIASLIQLKCLTGALCWPSRGYSYPSLAGVKHLGLYGWLPYFLLCSPRYTQCNTPREWIAPSACAAGS
ncbi:hypothetical protein B0H14DRAFT_3772519 [Mycena olivaceomarginata]|nr:hypothetical protein B0H14DRAFT_3772519 [Mycena olivaceomarginata]